MKLTKETVTIMVAIIALTILMMALKATGYLDWSWLMIVLAPVWIWAMFTALLLFCALFLVGLANISRIFFGK